MSTHVMHILIASAVVLALLLIVPLTRSPIAYTFRTIVHPAIQAILTHFALRLWAVALAIWRAHLILARNLTKPKERIYPDLQAQLERERKEKLKASL